MRMFRRRDAAASCGPVYCCQEDGMIGLGCGARSYTRGLHYSDEWAVGAAGVGEILARWVERQERDFATAWYGFDLDDEDQRVRYVVKSLLRHDGVALADYRRAFASQALTDLPHLDELLEHGLAVLEHGRLKPTARGLELSDLVGPWLYSQRVRRLCGGFALR